MKTNADRPMFRSRPAARRLIGGVGMLVIGFAIIVALREPSVDRFMVGMMGMFFVLCASMLVSSAGSAKERSANKSVETTSGTQP